ncbi:MAG: polyphosphate kinase 1 [Chlorobiales bacterium]|jgi:polyphosphate kinase|nr:polyphosphate kinase 1 [Chlorobiales bacterium]
MTTTKEPLKDVELVNNGSKPPVNLSKPAYFINRELSWIEFNKRVLNEALSDKHPLLERIKFISIFSSNLDEFYMIRIAGLEGQYEAGVTDRAMDGLVPLDQLYEIKTRVVALLEERNRCLYEDLAPKLEAEGIFFKKCTDLDERQKTVLTKYFDEQVFPVLTPLAFDPGHPFPYVSNLSLSLAIQLQGDDGEPRFARVKVPNTLPRIVRLDEISAMKLPNGQVWMLWLEDVIQSNLEKLFPGVQILEVHPFRVVRDADIEIEEDEAGDLLETIEKGIRQRRYGSVVRMDVNPGMPEYIKQILMENMLVTDRHVFEIPGVLQLSSLMELMDIDRPKLKDPPFFPKDTCRIEGERDMFDAIQRRDILLYHPYDSFQPVVDFIAQAAVDPNVLAIKQTLYRVGSKSPIVKALIEAAERGKQVAVLVELKARFDEENNIVWARALEKVGVHVVYGLIGLKTHGKVALVVRREQSGLKRYVHLGTGNYNPSTAKVYTDYSFFTTDEEIASDVTDIFNYLTGYSRQRQFRRLIVSPFNTRDSIIRMIQREVEHQKRGGNGRIIMKLNALVDPKTIKALYKASQAGVKTDLIVRGICSLRPGVKGVSENIRVISIVGRFLEHSRVFYFQNGGEEEVYLGSADMMERNLDRRVEIVFPILHADLRDEIKTELELMLHDNVKACELQQDGAYVHVNTPGNKVDSQHIFLTQGSTKSVIAKLIKL